MLVGARSGGRRIEQFSCVCGIARRAADLQISFFPPQCYLYLYPPSWTGGGLGEVNKGGKKIKEMKRGSGAEARCTPDEWIAMDGDGGKNNERQRAPRNN